MSNEDSKLPVTAKANLPAGMLSRASSWLKNAGPYLVAQSEKASERWAAHRGRVATAESLAQLILEEGKSAARVKEELLKQLPGADPVRAAEVRSVLRDVDASIRTVAILGKAHRELAALPLLERSNAASTDIAEHWYDKFFELCSMRNEGWRAGLLSKALAVETASPGSLNLDALWKIGTLSESEFHALAHMLDVCVTFGSEPMFLSPNNEFYAGTVPDSLVPGSMTYGGLLVILIEAGLVHAPTSSMGPFHGLSQGERCEVRYGARSCIFIPRSEVTLKGILFTRVGKSLARLYDAHEVPTGVANYELALVTLGQQSVPEGEEQSLSQAGSMSPHTSAG